MTITLSGTAENKDDYEEPELEFDFRSSDTEKTVFFALIDDMMDEGTETIIIEVEQNDRNNDVKTTLGTWTVKIGPSVVFSLLEESDRTLLENGGENEHSLLVVRSDGPVDEEQRVTLTFGGTATKGEDYRTESTLSISVGGISVGRNLTPLDDDLVEGDETIEITAWHYGRDIGTETITIIDDESMDATPPTVANAIPDQTATAGTAFSYAFPANTFSDADSDTLRYTATKADGTALPTWLSFTASTRAFSGTPQAADTGTVSVKVTASDGNGGSVSDAFDITVSAAADTTAPAFDSAVANGTSLVITFDEDLAAAASLANSAFTVKKTSGGTEATVTLSTTIAPVISGKTVTLILATALVATDTAVKVSYTKPATGSNNKLADATGNQTATFTDQPVTNNTGNTPATGAPTITGTARVGETLMAVTTGIRDADGLSSVSYTYQWIRVNGSDADISGATSSTYTLVAADEDKTIKVKVSFTDDASHSETRTSAATATVGAAADTTAPVFESAAANGASLVITFDEDLAAAANLANSAFTVKKTPSGRTEQTVTLSTTTPVISGRTVTLTLATALVSTDTAVKVSYTAPTTGTNNKLVDAASNATATFTDQTVTNTTPEPEPDPEPDPAPPVTDLEQVMGVGVAPGNAQLVVTWTAVDTATGYTLQWKSDGQGYNTGTRLATVTSGSTTRYTIPSLTNGTAYTVRVTATRTGATDGPPSAEMTGTPTGEPEPVPALPLAGAIGLGLLLLGMGGRALRGRARG